MLSPATHSADDVIRLLGLAPLPQEGGWFRRVAEGPMRDAAGRRPWSSVLALFTAEEFSALHRIDAEELWMHGAGDALEMMCLGPRGDGAMPTLGLDAERGHVPQVAIPAGAWQGARPVVGGRWTLVSCVVIPEFQWPGFELGRRDDLIAAHPEWTDAIRRFTRLP